MRTPMLTRALPLCLLLTTVAPALAETTSDIRAFVDQVLERELRDNQIPGAAFAFVRAGDPGSESRPVLRGYGMADLEAGTPVDPRRTIFRVGSNSKTITALAALQLVDRGELDLHRDIADRLSSLDIPSTFTQPITLFHLLTHTAGFTEQLFGQHTRTADRFLSLNAFLERHLTRRAQPPGYVISYNDYGSSLAGLLVAEVTGRPFERAADQLVFQPLGMTSSTFEQVSLPSGFEDRLARAYRLVGSSHRPLERDYVQTTPAAGLFTSAEDMASLLAALLDGGRVEGRQVVSERAVEAMLATQFQHDTGMLGRGFGFVEGRTNGYRTMHKDGQCSGFTARITVVPELGVGWFSVVNLSIFGRAGARLPVAGVHRRVSAALFDQFFAKAEDAAPDREGQTGRVGAKRAGAADRLEPAVTEPARAPSAVQSIPTSRLQGSFRETSDPVDSWASLFLYNGLAVGEAEGGISLFGAEPWQETAPLRFEYGSNVARFVADNEGRARWITFGPGAWQRVPLYRTQRFALMTGAALLALIVLLLGGIGWRRRRSESSLASGTTSISVAALLLLLFVLGFAAAMLITDIQLLFSGPTPLIRALLLLPPIALIAALIGLAGLTLPRRRQTAAPARTLSMLLAICCLGLIGLLRLWHLFGWS